jgi:hypothetical protein
MKLIAVIGAILLFQGLAVAGELEEKQAKVESLIWEFRFIGERQKSIPIEVEALNKDITKLRQEKEQSKVSGEESSPAKAQKLDVQPVLKPELKKK